MKLNDSTQLISIRLCFVACLAISVAACGNKQERPEYYESTEAKPLQVPEGLTAPRTDRAMVIYPDPMPLPDADSLETMPPRVANTAGGEDRNSRMAWNARGINLIVDDTLDSVARRLGIALERIGGQVSTRDANGVYEFDYRYIPQKREGFFSKLLFWRDDAPNFSGRYRTELSAEEDGTRIYIRQPDGSAADTDAAEHILGRLMERFG